MDHTEGHVGMDMGGDDTMSSMSMAMTFSSWSSYQLQILFSSWDITEKWQYVLSWFFIVIAVVFHHMLRYWVSIVEREMKQVHGGHRINSPFLVRSTAAVSFGSQQMKLRFIHSFLNCLSYGLGLMLMLVSMTYNPGLFLALVVGYFIGDYIFYPMIALPQEREKNEEDAAL